VDNPPSIERNSSYVAFFRFLRWRVTTKISVKNLVFHACLRHRKCLLHSLVQLSPQVDFPPILWRRVSWSVQRWTNGHLSRRASPSFDRYRIILFDDAGTSAWETCSESLCEVKRLDVQLSSWLAVWLNGNALALINEVTLYAAPD